MREITRPYRHGLLLSLLLVLALFVAACGQDEPEPVAAPVGADTADVVEATAVATEGAITTDEADVVATTVMTDTIVDTNVITEIEVLTQTDVANIRVVTEVMTNTDVTVDTASNTESAIITETEDLNTGQALVIVLIADTAGNQFLGDPLSQRPIFASENEGLVVDEHFEPLIVGEQTVFDEDLDRNLVGEIDRNGIRQLTYNNHPLYRFVGGDEEDWRSYADQQQLVPLTATGDIGDFAQ